MGILITIGAIGAVTAAAGRMMGDVGRYGNYFVAVILFVVGLHLLGVIPMPGSGPGQVGMKRKGLLAAFILGLVMSRREARRLIAAAVPSRLLVRASRGPSIGWSLQACVSRFLQGRNRATPA